MILATCSLAEKWKSMTDVINGHYPLGTAALHAVVESAGHHVETLHLLTDPTETCVAKVLAAVENQQADVLGLSMITDTRVASYRAIEAAHQRFPRLQIVLGGIHASIMYQQLLRKYPFTIVVLGEGEVTLVELLAALETGRDLSEIAGIAYVKNGQVITTAARPLVEDLDSLPFPRHEIFFTPERTEAQLLTSRGCPFTCSFCSLDSLSRRRVRKRSAKNVADEIEHILRTFPQTKSIQILDDQFFIDNERVIELCDEIVRRGLKCSFLCQGRVKPLSRELVLALERAGFVHVLLGLESGSAEILERCRKKIQIPDVERALHLFADSPISVGVLLIIGLPGETAETIRETIEVCRRLQNIKYHYYNIKIQDLFIYPGTEVYQDAKLAGAIDDDFWLTDADCPRYEVDNSPEQYLKYRMMAIKDLCLDSITTEQGYLSQKDMTHSIIKYKYLYKTTECDKIIELVEAAVTSALAKGTLSFIGVKPWDTNAKAVVTARKPGTDDSVMLGQVAFPNDIFEILRHAYIFDLQPITNAVERCVCQFLEEAFAAADRRLIQFQAPYIRLLEQYLQAETALDKTTQPFDVAQ